MNSLDAFVTRFRRALENVLPWYDREQEERKIERTEYARQRSIKARIRAESQVAEQRLRR